MKYIKAFDLLAKPLHLKMDTSENYSTMTGIVTSFGILVIILLVNTSLNIPMQKLYLMVMEPMN